MTMRLSRFCGAAFFAVHFLRAALAKCASEEDGRFFPERGRRDRIRPENKELLHADAPWGRTNGSSVVDICE